MICRKIILALSEQLPDKTYLRNDFKPDINVDSGKTLANSRSHPARVSICKPESQQPQGILQRVARRKRDGLKEAFNSRDDISRKVNR